MLHRRAFTGFIVGAGLAAATKTALAQAKTVDVGIVQRTSRFDPETVQINAGDTVTWTNSGFVTHTVTCDPSKSKNCVLPAGAMAFDSPELGEDGTYSQTFAVKGSYTYVCKYHESMGMIGKVVVV